MLTEPELSPIRMAIAREADLGTKPPINAALNALDDWWISTGRIGAATAIETAAPGVFTNAQKKLIGKWWVKHLFDKGG